MVRNHLYMDHDEETLDTKDHECDLDAYCKGCNALLPWALYQIRELDGVAHSEAPGVDRGASHRDPRRFAVSERVVLFRCSITWLFFIPG